MAKKKEPIGWFTMNGRHVPLYEGESKADAISRATKESVKKQQENIKKNEDQKAKDFAKAENEKDAFYKNENGARLKVISDDGKYIHYRITTDKNDDLRGVSRTNEDRLVPKESFKKMIQQNKYSKESEKKVSDGVKGSSGNKDWSKQDIQKLADSRKISYDEAKKIVERYNKPDNAGDAAVDRFRNASSGKASDEARVDKYDLKNPPKNKSSEEYENWYRYADSHLTDWQKANGHSSFIVPDVPSTPMYFDSFRTTLRKKEPGFKGKSIPQVVSKLKTMSYDERGKLYEKYTHITHIPASFEKSYPNLSYSELKKKYEEYLKKNRK